MDLATHGVNKAIKFFSLANYSLTTQIIIINLSTSLLALLFLLVFNFYLMVSKKNLENQDKFVSEKIEIISSYLSKNAVKRILTFDDSCSSISKGTNRESAKTDCNEKNLTDTNYLDQLPQLDPYYAQQYVYSNFLNTKLNIKVISDNWMKLADTNDVYSDGEEVIISDIDSKIEEKIKKKLRIYNLYEEIYFSYFNYIKKFFDIKKLNNENVKKTKNDYIILMKSIKTKLSTSYIYKDQENFFKVIFASPILKDNKVYGVVLIDSPINFDDSESAKQSILLTNFFLFFISIMFFLSFLFSKSIVTPIKILSHNTNLERDKTSERLNLISYPNRNDEIGTLSKDIEGMSSDLKKRIKEIEEFSSDVSHELKNPLAGLKSSTDLLNSKTLSKKNKDILMQNISDDINRMNILISDISNYSLTQVEISEEIFEKTELLNFLNNFKDSLINKNSSIEIINPNEKIYIKINKIKLMQVLRNLFDNALTFSPLNSKIYISIKKIDNFCVINFIDQGAGIPLEYKDKIFERFYTDRVKDRNSHSGLGLSISKRIIESFGGNINLVKNSNISFKGACFEIKLPLED